MKSVTLRLDQLWTSPDLDRSRKDKQFEDRLRASIEQIGLIEPLKVTPVGKGHYLIVDGVLRWRAMKELRADDPSRFRTVPAYVVSHDHRYEVRYQTDIYQDLLPSQLAALVEHLHKNDHVRKSQIALYIGVSAPTVRNYTGLWRLIQRGDLFARIVDLMDIGVVPSSNPYAWLRLTEIGLRTAIEMHLADGGTAEDWVEQAANQAAVGQLRRLSLQAVEVITGSLPPDCYREDESVRSQKRELGLRRAKQISLDVPAENIDSAMRNLRSVVRRSDDPVLQIAARSLQALLA